MGQRWRSKGKASSDDEDRAVIILSSSDDEEANEDLSIKIVERARQHEAKRKRSDDGPVSARLTPVVDLSSTSSDEVEAAPDQRAAVVDGLDLEAPAEGEAKKKKRKKSKKKKKKAEDNGALQVDPHVEAAEPLGTTDSAVSDSMVIEVNETSENMVLRKLLRGARYFDDPEDRVMETCYNCGEEGHIAVNCTMEKRKRPCFVCGMFGHNAKQCTQGQDCYICKKRGHFAKDCPDKHKQIPQDSKICLRCGDVGHDISSCKNNYASDDLKEIRCYVCNKYGHLCCADISFDPPKEVSCYNCAQFGHTGLGCAKQRGEASAFATPTLCYKCGGEGHFARGCTKNNIKPSRWKGESSTPTHRFSKTNRDSRGFKSEPRDFGKAHKRKSGYEERRNTTAGKSRIKGGWFVDDPGDLPRMKHQGNGWMSPTTPVRNGYQGHSSASPWPSSSSSWSPRKKYNSFVGTPSQHHGYSASRFGYSRDRSWRK